MLVVFIYWAENGSWKPVAKYTSEVNVDILQVPVLAGKLSVVGGNSIDKDQYDKKYQSCVIVFVRGE